MFVRKRNRHYDDYGIPLYAPSNPYDPRNQPGGGYGGYGYGSGGLGYRLNMMAQEARLRSDTLLWNHHLLIATVFVAAAGVISAVAGTFILDHTLHDWHTIIVFVTANVQPVGQGLWQSLFGGLVHGIAGGVGGSHTTTLNNVLGR